MRTAFARCVHAHGLRPSSAFHQASTSYISSRHETRAQCKSFASSVSQESSSNQQQRASGASRKLRLERLLSNLGYCSRSEVSTWVGQGRITTVHGKRITKASLQVHAEDILVDGQPLDAMTPFTLLLDKPTDYTCSASDPAGGALVYDLLPHRFGQRKPVLSTVGRLDKDASGLLLMTDDGQLLHSITSPKRKIWKVYDVTLARPLEGTEAEVFSSGTLVLRNEDSPVMPAQMHAVGERRALLAICEGRYHQVKRMFAAVGNHVEALRRVRIGGLELPSERIRAGRHWCVATAEDLQAVLQEGSPDLAALAARLAPSLPLSTAPQEC